MLAGNERDTFTFRSRVEEVSLTFSVTDRRGGPVPALSPEDVTVLDSSQAVREVRLANYDQLPVRVGLLVDWSDSLQDRRGFERQAATEFLRRIMRPDFDDGFVMGIAAKPQITQPLTRDPEALITSLTVAKDGFLTSLYDAIFVACSGEMGQSIASGRTARRAIILLSDGQDTDSMHGLDDAVRAAQEADVTIFPVARRGKHWDLQGERVLMRLAEATGGRAYIVGSAAQYESAFAFIERTLRAGYTVSYKPVNLKRDGRFRPVEIRPRNPNLVVHARSGYYAPME
ncbi:MAG: VWA domain-containing protein [Acidobacteria bacterium]|nr:VWA domain-containing protein [Acidobacteriota bacterium]